MGTARKSVGILAALIAFAAGTCYAEDVDNPMYKHWAKFKPGTSVTMTTVTEVAGNKSESKSTTTLKEVTPEKVVVEMSMAGMPEPMKMEFKAKTPKVEATTTTKPDMKTSEEEIEVAGKKVKCKVTEITSEMGGMKSTTKSWTSDEIPGMAAKSEMTSSMMSSKSNVTEMTVK